jgi:hypothetical protein
MADGLPLAGNRARARSARRSWRGALLAVQARCAVMADQIFYVYGSTHCRTARAFPRGAPISTSRRPSSRRSSMGGLVMVYAFSRRRDGELVARSRGRAPRSSSRGGSASSPRSPRCIRASIPIASSRRLRTVQARYEESLAAGEEKLDDADPGAARGGAAAGLRMKHPAAVIAEDEGNLREELRETLAPRGPSCASAPRPRTASRRCRRSSGTSPTCSSWTSRCRE